jgi:hypothetical protein
MKANELRIGNLVKCNFLGNTYKDRNPYFGSNIFSIYSACKDFVKLDLGHNALQKVEILEIKPIPLTEEWLLKFGFDKKGNKGKLNVILSGNFGYKNGKTYFNSWVILESQPKYVHQLQNIYFALTGEELTFKSE